MHLQFVIPQTCSPHQCSKPSYAYAQSNIFWRMQWDWSKDRTASSLSTKSCTVSSPKSLKKSPVYDGFYSDNHSSVHVLKNIVLKTVTTRTFHKQNFYMYTVHTNTLICKTKKPDLFSFISVTSNNHSVREPECLLSNVLKKRYFWICLLLPIMSFCTFKIQWNFTVMTFSLLIISSKKNISWCTNNLKSATNMKHQLHYFFCILRIHNLIHKNVNIQCFFKYQSYIYFHYCINSVCFYIFYVAI